MLEVLDLAVSYGQHRALKGVALTVAPGEIVVILGANGAGKTSLLKATAGLVAAEARSRVRLDGQPLSGLPPHRIVEAGLALVPEGRGIFADLSVRENLLLGAFAQRAREQQAGNLERVLGLFPKLAERSAQLPRTMSGGEQQMVAIGRALMAAPTILMLDEPSLGLSPLLCTELFRTLQSVRDSGVGILLVEQNARQSLAIADRAYLLENGLIVGQGPAAELARDPAVQAAYLGGAAAAPSTAQRPVQRSDMALPAPAPPGPPAAGGPGTRAALAAQTPFDGRAGHDPSTTPADAWLPTSVANLVRIATQRQAEALHPAPAAADAPAHAAQAVLMARACGELEDSGTLQAALTRIEAAARAVSSPTGAAGPSPARPAGKGSAPATASPPQAARGRGIEIHRRQADGSFKREV